MLQATPLFYALILSARVQLNRFLSFPPPLKHTLSLSPPLVSDPHYFLSSGSTLTRVHHQDTTTTKTTTGARILNPGDANSKPKKTTSDFGILRRQTHIFQSNNTMVAAAELNHDHSCNSSNSAEQQGLIRPEPVPIEIATDSSPCRSSNSPTTTHRYSFNFPKISRYLFVLLLLFFCIAYSSARPKRHCGESLFYAIKKACPDGFFSRGGASSF